MQDDYLTRVVVDTSGRKFNLYSENGDEKIIECETIDEFMGVLEFCREILDDDAGVCRSTCGHPKLTSVFKKGRKKFRQKIAYYFFMNRYSDKLYAEVLDFYEWNSSQLKNSNEILMHFLKGSKMEKAQIITEDGKAVIITRAIYDVTNSEKDWRDFWYNEETICDI